MLTSSLQDLYRPLPTSDNTEDLQEWLKDALLGNDESKTRLFSWVHTSALQYFKNKCMIEPLLGMQDAQDLASECIEEFSKAWQRIRSVSHYCRRMFKNNLRRYLKRKRRGLQRECSLMVNELEYKGKECIAISPHFEFERMSDEDRRRHRTAERELRCADEVIKKLFHYRVFAGSLTYAEIAHILGASETSLRMRMARFNRKVRNRHDRAEKRRCLHRHTIQMRS